MDPNNLTQRDRDFLSLAHADGIGVYSFDGTARLTPEVRHSIKALAKKAIAIMNSNGPSPAPLLSGRGRIIRSMKRLLKKDR